MVAAKVRLKGGKQEVWLGDSLYRIKRVVAFAGPPHRKGKRVPVVGTLRQIPVAQVRYLEGFGEAVQALKRGNCGGAYSLGIVSVQEVASQF